MANRRDSFVFYRSFKEAIEECPIDDQLEIYKAITDFALNGERPNLQSSFGRICWRLIEPVLVTNWNRYVNGCRGKEFGDKGGAPKGNKNALKQPQNNPKTTPNKDKDVDNKENIDIPKKADGVSLNQSNIEKRREDFILSLKPYIEQYGKEMCNRFFSYWTEPNKSHTKMRFELEKTWDLSRRLKRWANNNFKS